MGRRIEITGSVDRGEATPREQTELEGQMVHAQELVSECLQQCAPIMQRVMPPSDPDKAMKAQATPRTYQEKMAMLLESMSALRTWLCELNGRI